MLKNIFYALYGICLVGGGYMGYQTAQSAMSLVMGSIELMKIGYSCIARRYRNIFSILAVAFFF